MVKRSERWSIIEVNLDLGMGIGHQRPHPLPTDGANFFVIKQCLSLKNQPVKGIDDTCFKLFIGGDKLSLNDLPPMCAHNQSLTCSPYSARNVQFGLQCALSRSHLDRVKFNMSSEKNFFTIPLDSLLISTCTCV